MEKNITRVYLIILFLGIAYFIFMAAGSTNNTFIRNNERMARVFDLEQTKVGNDYYYYRMTLPESGTEGKCIVYNTVHMYMDVQIDGKTVYRMKSGRDARIKTTGYQWNTITLTKDDAGKDITFKVTPVYKNGVPKDTFYYGNYGDVERRIVWERLPKFIVAAAIFIVGIVLMFYVSFVLHQKKAALVPFSVFALLLGIWSMCESQILDLFLSGTVLLVFVSHMMLMIMPIPFVLFLRQIYHNGSNPVWLLYCYANCGIVAVRVALQCLGMFDLRQTLWLTHLSIIVFIAICVGLSIQEVVVNKMSRQVELNIGCVVMVMASAVAELVVYNVSNTSASIGSFGFFLYVLIIGIDNVRRSGQMLERAKENEIYRKLAFTDELTGLYNRTAYKHDVSQRTEVDEQTKKSFIRPTVVFLFDLNNLKQCNDNFGHDYGDQYICTAADAMREVFEPQGKCYRIGGDEFCAIMSDTSMQEILAKMAQLRQRMIEKNRKKFVVTMSIASGYAIYDSDLDKDLDDTVKRADEMMYKDKQEYKERSQREG